MNEHEYRFYDNKRYLSENAFLNHLTPLSKTENIYYMRRQLTNLNAGLGVFDLAFQFSLFTEAKSYR